MKRILLFVFMLVAISAVAQNAYYVDRAVMKDPFSGGLQAIPYAPVRVCLGTDSTGVWPCPHVAQIYDVLGNAISTAIGSNAGQINTDSLGRFNFQCTSANYLVQVVAAGSNTPSLSYYITCSTLQGGTNSDNFWTGVNTFKQINNKCYVSRYSGADWSVKVNAAIADSSCSIIENDLSTAQTIGTTVSITRPLMLLLGRLSATATVAPAILTSGSGTGSTIKGLGRSVSVINAGANGDTIRLSAGQETLEGADVEINSGSFPTAIGIHVTSGNSQNILHNTVNGCAGNTSGACLEVDAPAGHFMVVDGGLYQGGANVPTVVINGNDPFNNPANRHFSNLDLGGGTFDIQGAETTYLTNSSINGFAMNSSAKKFMMYGTRVQSGPLGNVTVSGIDHSFVGNIIASTVTIDSSVLDMTYFGTSVGGIINNSTDPNNCFVDSNSGVDCRAKLAFYGQVGIGAAPPSSSIGLFVQKNTSGTAFQYGSQFITICDTSATGECTGITSRGQTTGAAFTNSNNDSFLAQDAVKGAGSTITNSTGFYAALRSSGTNNFGFFSETGNNDSFSNLRARTTFNLGTSLLMSATAPTIASGFGSGATIAVSNGTASFNVGVGTGGVASNGVITMPAATTGWTCSVNNLTAAAGHRADNTVQTASTTTSVTIENQTKSTGAAVAWTASDSVRLNCQAN